MSRSRLLGDKFEENLQMIVSVPVDDSDIPVVVGASRLEVLEGEKRENGRSALSFRAQSFQ